MCSPMMTTLQDSPAKPVAAHKRGLALDGFRPQICSRLAALGLAIFAVAANVMTAHAVAATSSIVTSGNSTVASGVGRSVEARLARIERVLEGQVMLEMLQRIESLQAEVQELRGELEQQGFEQGAMKKRQRTLYLDTDQRLQTLETAPRHSPGTVAGTAVASSGGLGASGAGNSASDTTSNSSSQASAAGQREQAAYMDAFNYLKLGRYDDAARAFEGFLQRYPTGDYADNAQYWLGEAHYVASRYQEAIEAFSVVARQFPNSSKVADARLKIGYSYYELKEWQPARKVLTALEQDFPNTAAARLAAKRLAKIRQEGH